MRPTHIALFLAALVLAGCRSGNTTPGGIPTLDLEAAIDNPRPFDLAEIAKSIEFIPLDDSDPDGILARVYRLAESESRFYITDDISRPVKVFDLNGKYLTTRGSIGRGPNEFLGVNEIAVDPATDNLYVVAVNNSLIAYDSSGRMFARNDSVNSSSEMAWAGDRLLIMRGSELRFDFSGATAPPPAPDSMEVVIDILSPDLSREDDIETHAKGMTYVIFFESSENSIRNIRIFSSSNILSDNGESIVVKEGRSDTVHRFRPDNSLEPAFRLDFGKYTPPAEAFGTNPNVSLDRYYLTSGLWHADSRTIVSAYKADLGMPHVFLILDEDEPAGGFSAMGPDGKPGLFLDGIAFSLKYIRNNRLVGAMSALDIVDNAEKLTRPDLKALASNLKEDSNPVVVVATLKK